MLNMSREEKCGGGNTSWRQIKELAVFGIASSTSLYINKVSQTITSEDILSP
jgi:hypothetical protein